MKLPPRLLALERAARRRRVAIVFAIGAPLAVAATVIAFRIGAVTTALVAAVAAVIAIAAWARLAIRSIDRTWIARRLDAARPDLENSAELLYPGAGPQSGLAPLQRTLLTQRLESAPAIDIRERWPSRRVAQAWVFALAAIAAAHWWPATAPDPIIAQPDAGPAASAAASATLVSGIRIDVQPPAYTGVAARSESVLAFRAEAGATVRWRLRFDPVPASAVLAFHDGTEQALAPGDDGWTAERVIDVATLYRLRVDGAPALADDSLHRIEVVPDLPPELRVVAPEKTLTLVEPGQRRWDLAFEAADDYGLGEARLTVTVAKGSGEQVEVSERSVVLAGEGDARSRRYARALELAWLGVAAGDDAIVRLTLRDNRVPQPNVARSPSLILRWPAAAAGETSGMDGLVERTLPAYFRSQRQIIIDTEALVALRPRPARDDFVDRSDRIGVDQKILRLRYGQFLGEEAKTYGQPGESEHAGELPQGFSGDTADRPEFDQATAVLEEFGHAHDIAEAATLLDPETKALLKAALAQMWDAELQLRLGEPARALPYEYAALEYIKQVQQASRIYLSRVGLEVPGIDESRRLSGDRAGARSRSEPVAAATGDDPAVVGLWRALDGPGALAWDDFDVWVREHEAGLPDALGLLAAVDALKRDPACAPCRQRVRQFIWALLPVPAAGTRVRETPDAAGRMYLDALREAGP
jgi:hypothetical protein